MALNLPFEAYCLMATAAVVAPLVALDITRALLTPERRQELEDAARARAMRAWAAWQARRRARQAAVLDPDRPARGPWWRLRLSRRVRRSG